MSLFGSFNKDSKPGLLTEKLLRKWYDGEVELVTSDYTELDESALKYLIKHDKEGFFYFDGVKDLPKAIASRIAQLEGGVSLKGLEQVPDEIASALTKMKGRLYISGAALCKSSRTAAEKLIASAEHKHESLGPCVDSDIEMLNRQVAEVIHAAMMQSEDALPSCVLTALRSIDEDVAQVFSVGDYSLDLSGIESISAEAAAALARHTGDLNLSGLKTVSDEVASGLSGRVGDLYLDGLEVLSDTAAEYLASVDGVLSLSALSGLSEASIQSFAAGKCLLRIRKALESHGGETNFFAKDYEFRELSTLSPDVAKVLAIHNGQLSFQRLTHITDEVAVILSKHSGGLSFDAVTNISDAAAAALAQSKQFIWMENIETVSQKAYDMLVHRSWGADLGKKHGLEHSTAGDDNHSESQTENDDDPSDLLKSLFGDGTDDDVDGARAESDRMMSEVEDILRMLDEPEGPESDERNSDDV